VAAARAKTLRPQVAAKVAAGWTAHLATLTLRHTREATLAELFVIMGEAWNRVITGAAWNGAGGAGAPKFIRGYDYTRTRRNGHHLHLHVLLLLPPVHGDGEALTDWFLQRWMEKVRDAGGEALPDAQHVERADNPDGALTYAVTPAACYEAVGMAKKRGRGAHESGETPFEIQARAVAGDPEAKAWWREYVAATKGKKQVSVSRCFKLSGDADLIAENEAEEAGEPGGDALVALTSGALRAADRAGLIPKVLAAAEAGAGDPDAVRATIAELLRTLPAGTWWLLPPSGHPPGDARPRSASPSWLLAAIKPGDPAAAQTRVAGLLPGSWWTAP
jgi:hypothetical protein